MLKIEMAFRIYHRLQRKSKDYCDTVIIHTDKRANPALDPTAVTVRFIPPRRRELSSTERSILKHFCAYHKLKYNINEDGEMVFSSCKETVILGGEKHFKTS